MPYEFLPDQKLNEPRRLELLTPPRGRVRAVLDTDAFNEIDDQFAVVWALLSRDEIELEALYAAPFQRSEGGARAPTPEIGMELSYEEVGRLLERLDGPMCPVYRGSTRWLADRQTPVESPAAEDLVARALAPGDNPLYVLAIGAPTNVASALLAAPEIAERIVVVWLGGNPWHWSWATEFNVAQDLHASHVLLDSGVPLVHVPARGVTEGLRTCQAEIERFLLGQGAIGDYLAGIYERFYEDHFGRSKEIWDLGAVAWLVDPAWMPTTLIHCRALTADGTWSYDPRRHFIREAFSANRDAIFTDLYRKVAAAKVA